MLALFVVFLLGGELVARGAGDASDAVFARGLLTSRVAPARGDAAPLPESLVVSPGRYAVGGSVYDMTREGYYRIGSEQRIVYSHSLGALLSGLAWGAGQGSRDDGKPPQALASTFMQRRLSLTCGYLVELAHLVLSREGYESRSVAALTSHRFNGTNGHTMIEVLQERRWTLYDLDYDMQPLVDGAPTTIVQWVKPGVRRGFRPLARDAPALRTLPPAYRYVVVGGVPLVSDPASTWPYYYTAPADRKRVSGYSAGYRYLPPKLFYARFYPPRAA